MVRARFTYAKRGRACFIPHIAIPSVFSRSGTRAGIPFLYSEGFTPRPKISLGPELSVGVPALCEPFEVWVEYFDESMAERWNRCLPPGFFITGGKAVEALPGTEGAKSLNKWCRASSCLFALRDGSVSGVRKCLEELRGEGTVLYFEEFPLSGVGFYRCIMEDPSKRGPGLLVKALAAKGAISGWADLLIVREAVGELVYPDEKCGSPVVRCLVDQSVPGCPEKDIS